MPESISRRILLVEDEAILAMTEKMELEKFGYAVRTVTTGEKAVEAAKTSDDIDLILMDINLGNGIDGTQAAEIILKNRDIPVVFLSSHTDPEIVGKTEKITSYGYVVKSSSITVLDASIKMAFKLFATRRLANDTFTHSINGLCVHRLIRDESGNLQDCEYLRVNDSFERHTGLFSQDIIGRTIRDLYPGTEADDVIRLYDEVLSGRADAQQEFYFKPTQTWYELSIFRTQEDEFTVVAHNITKRKRIEEELLRNGDLLEKTQQLARIGGWVWDTKQQTMTWTDETYRIHGMTPDEFAPGTPEHIKASLACYDPADRTIIEAAFGLCAGDGQPYDLECPLTRVDGSRIWIRTMADAEKQGDQVVRVFGNIIDITDLKQAEEEMHKEKNNYYAITNLTGDIIVQVDAEGHWKFLNDIALSFWGGSQEELLRKPFSDFLHPEDKEETISAIMKMIETGEAQRNLTNRQMTPEGWRVVQWNGMPMYDNGEYVGFQATGRDITERKRLEQELISQKQYLETILETTADGFWLVTPDRFITNANPSYCKMSGYSKDELERMEINDLDAIENPQETAERMKRIMENGSETFETKHRRKDWSIFDVEVSASCFDRADEMCLVCFCRDITDRKRAEEKIQKQLSEKEILLREVHHRVKNNIANIEGLLSLQAGSTANAEVKAALQEALSRVQSMRVLYDKLLLSDDLHEISIKHYAEGLIDSLVMAYDPGKTILIEKCIADFKIDSKKAFFVGIIVNELLTNVFKYAFKDCDSGLVSVSITKEKGSMTLIIQDNGSGFNKRALKNKSPGFGRTIVRMLVEQLDGTYGSGNEDGARSVVRFGI